VHAIIAADIVQKHAHNFAWYQHHYGAARLGPAGPYLLAAAVLALILLAGHSVLKRS
jgi:hypothetical protein